MAHLALNKGAPMMALSGGGGSFTNASSSVADSLMSLFAPGSDNTQRTTSGRDFFQGQSRSRFEVPDTANTLDLGTTIVYMMLSNGEDFYTRTILPIVEWDWSVKNFSYSTWVFPQHCVRATPETAPPRFVDSYQFNETTSLVRYATGHHMSVEYMNTAMGKDQQKYNLKQLALNVQERLNLNVIQALMNCKSKLAARREASNSYALSDLEAEFKKEVSRFCRVQKEKYGFLTLWEEIKSEMKSNGGEADSVIITEKSNTLVLHCKEYVSYMEAGPSGPETVKNPNRSFLPTQQNTHYSNTFPERMGASLGPWQQLVQIGTFNQSYELKDTRQHDKDYFKCYNSKARSVWIFNVYQNAFVEIDIESMIHNCQLWTKEGNLRIPGMSSRGGSSIIRSDTGNKVTDFLTMNTNEIISEDYWKVNPYENKFSKNTANVLLSSGHQSTESGLSASSTASILSRFLDNNNGGSGNNNGGVKQPIRRDGVTAIGLLGHLRESDFGNNNIVESGEMLLQRIAERSGKSSKWLTQVINDGLQLSLEMSKKPIDYDWIDYTLRNAILTMYRGNHQLNEDDDVETPHLKKAYVDPTTNSHADMWDNIQRFCLLGGNGKDEQTGRMRILKNIFEGNSCLPLPTREDSDNDKFSSKSFTNLTGYCGFNGFTEMAKVWRSSNGGLPHLNKRYNMKQLEIANDFIIAMETIADGIQTILPNCLLLNTDMGTGKTNSLNEKARIIAEKVFNMVGSPVWVNLKKYNLFMMDTATAGRYKTRGRVNANDYMGTADPGKLIADNIEGPIWYTNVIHRAMASYYGTLFEDLVLGVGSYFANMGKKVSNLDATISEITTPLKSPFDSVDNIMKLVKLWIKPKIDCANLTKNKPSLVKIPKVAKGLFNYTEMILFSSHLNLQIFQCVIEAVILGSQVYKDDLNTFISLLIDLDIMITTHDTSKTAPSDVFQAIYEKYFANKVKGGLRRIQAKLAKAQENDASFTQELEGMLSGAPNIKLNIPLLSKLKQFKSLDIDTSKYVTPDNTAKPPYKFKDDWFIKFLTNHVVDQVGRELGAKTLLSEAGGDTDDVMIGVKQTKKSFDRQDQQSSYSYDKDISSFFKTSLVFSAEQIFELCTSGNDSMLSNHFDVRVSHPGNPTKFISKQDQPELLREMEKLNNFVGVGKEINWRSMPLYFTENKEKKTIYGAPLGQGWRFSGGAGLPVTALTRQFEASCLAIDTTSVTKASRMCSLLYMCTSFNKQTMLALCRNNMRVPMNFLLVRPHRNLKTESMAILSAGINKLGFTPMACNDYSTGQTVLTKEWNGHLSFMSTAIVMHPENCHVQHNVMSAGLGTGHGTEFFQPESYSQSNSSQHSYDEHFPSLFCFAIPFTETITKQYICTPGKIPQLCDSTKSTTIIANQNIANKLDYTTAPRYNDIWRFDRKEDTNIQQLMGFTGTAGNMYNTQCYRDTAKYWDVHHKQLGYITLGTGHLGENIGPGLKQVLEGAAVPFPDFQYAKSKYNVIA